MQRNWAAVLASCVVFAGALAGCATSPVVVADAPAPAPTAEATCYRQSDLDPGAWEHLDWSEESCFASDACHGGVGGPYNSGCLKWARGPNAPPLPWSAEATGDEPPGRPLPTDEGLPLEHGLFAFHEICGETEDPCRIVRWRANARAPIYAEPDATSRRVGRINPDEVVVMRERARFVAARRGVVVDGYYGMNAGDVVYAIEQVCKSETVWRRGDIIHGIDGGVEWEPRQRLYNPTAGSWVRLERANGQRGWARASVLGVYLAEDPPRIVEPVQEESEYEYDECE